MWGTAQVERRGSGTCSQKMSDMAIYWIFKVRSPCVFPPLWGKVMFLGRKWWGARLSLVRTPHGPKGCRFARALSGLKGLEDLSHSDLVAGWLGSGCLRRGLSHRRSNRAQGDWCGTERGGWRREVRA